MKNKLLLLWLPLLFLLTLPLRAASPTIHLEWDANDPLDLIDHYTLYEKTSALGIEVWKQVGTTQSLAFPLIDLTPGPHTYVVTATNQRGESDYSNEITLPGLPKGPTRLRLVIEIGVGTQ